MSPLFKYSERKVSYFGKVNPPQSRAISKVEIADAFARPIFPKESFSIFNCFLTYPFLMHVYTDTCVLGPK